MAGTCSCSKMPRRRSTTSSCPGGSSASSWCSSRRAVSPWRRNTKLLNASPDAAGVQRRQELRGEAALDAGQRVLPALVHEQRGALRLEQPHQPVQHPLQPRRHLRQFQRAGGVDLQASRTPAGSLPPCAARSRRAPSPWRCPAASAAGDRESARRGRTTCGSAVAELRREQQEGPEQQGQRQRPESQRSGQARVSHEAVGAEHQQRRHAHLDLQRPACPGHTAAAAQMAAITASTLSHALGR